MISVVIRNKNEAKALSDTLLVLTKIYANDIDEIILVDNNSTDNSIEIAKKYGCKIINISNFSYGKATNLGISKTKNQYVLLLSAHAGPIGNSFFKTSLNMFKENNLVAGLRYVNSQKNYIRAVNNNFIVLDGLNHGLMTACAMINKLVWEKHRFDESLVFSEDKAWSKDVIEAGYVIKDVNETFFYFAKRNSKAILNRWKFETQASYQLTDEKYLSYFKIFGIYFYNLIIGNIKYLGSSLVKETQKLKAHLQVKKNLKR